MGHIVVTRSSTSWIFSQLAELENCKYIIQCILKKTQYVLIQESAGILDMELPCTKHILAQYRGVCPQWEMTRIAT
jgi:hypothetical protein